MKKVKIVEVGLRDGLQNESVFLTVQERFNVLNKIIESGLNKIEVGSFVSAKWVPQMAGTDQLVQLFNQKYSLQRQKNITASVLVPNEFGMSDAVKNQVKEVAVFISSSETFSQKNINCTISESLKRVEQVILLAKKNKIKVRGYLSVCFGCPYEGKVSESKVVQLAKKLYQMGCYEVSIGDTIGIAYPEQVSRLFKKLVKVISRQKCAGHFHDTRGLAIANIWAAYQQGVKIFDSSLGGLGGCPYAKGASGNVSTEDVVNLFHQSGVATGVDLKKLVSASHELEKYMKKSLNSRISKINGKL